MALYNDDIQRSDFNMNMNGRILYIFHGYSNNKLCRLRLKFSMIGT